MALLRLQLERYLLAKLPNGNLNVKPTNRNGLVPWRAKSRCSAIAIDAPSSLADFSGIRWGSTTLQGLRDEMEDDIVVRSDGLAGFSFAAVFDGHGGSSSVKFLRDELYKECAASLQDGLLLSGQDFNAIRKALQDAFENLDMKLLNWLEKIDEEEESGSTATVIIVKDNTLIISHIGDSSVVLSRSGKTEVLTDPHRPYGSSKVSLEEIRRIREAGGWIVNGRICGDIAVSRAFGDMRFKTKKNEFGPIISAYQINFYLFSNNYSYLQSCTSPNTTGIFCFLMNRMLEKGVKEGRWSEKFSSRVQFRGDLVVASPEIYQITLGSDAEFILLASDGLWDYVKSSEAVGFIRNQLRQHGNVQLACEELGRAALDRRTQDNVSIIIADLGRTDWQALPLQQQNVVYELGQAFATLAIVSLGIWMTSQLSF